ncbi:adenosylcobinamide-GDP ribazoletransferase [Vibrio viridaestus]|uniref:Adenosylcobinamide-GDP ribazoletransferase n=1 Tax=Vibrio viridaestus TaxID=2487322 RepID=A0A3N9TJP5_9VIBR|nr:adenosylcobinamide-GDP ribazoletransferase [Vibrio viridaestus]RQW64549.1 adenosylcobinamide-GDP ribazoletransferase [Vibrio viridaestus]
MKMFLAMLQFMTRIPVPYQWTEDLDFSKSYRGIIWFPIVGAVVGMLASLIFHIFYAGFEVGPWLSAAMYVFALALITGGLHLDGLADTCDGIFSARKREQMLEIMKDSRIGTHGVLALIFVLVIKMLIVAQLVIKGEIGYLSVLFSAPIASRTLMAVLMHHQKYAREEGLGNIFIGKIATSDFYWCIGLGALFCIVVTGLFWPFILSLVCAYLIRVYLNKILGGQTGDTLGAACELLELVFLMFVLIIS